MRKPLQRKNPSVLAGGKGGRPIVDRNKSYFSAEEFQDRELPLIYKPKVIKKLGDCCYVFHCTVKGNTGNRFNNNMVALVDRNPRQQQHATAEQVARGVVTIVNPLRLSPEGEDKLLELGVLTNMIRLGPSEHAAFEDEYYLTKFPDLQRWAPGPFAACPNLPLHQVLYDTTPARVLKLDQPISPVSPHPDIQVFVFEETVQPEAVLIMTSKRALIVGDCLQHQQNNPYVNDGVRNQYHEKHGLLSHRIVVSDQWLYTQSVINTSSKKIQNSFQTRAQKNKSFFSGGGSGKVKLRNDFSRLLTLDIARLISTSGNGILQDDSIKSEIAEAVQRTCVL